VQARTSIAPPAGFIRVGLGRLAAKQNRNQVIDRILDAGRKSQVLADPMVAERFRSFGAEPSSNTPAQFAAQFKADVARWVGAWFPAKTPEPIVNQASALLNQILALEQTRDFLARVAAEPWAGSPASLAAVVPREMAKWGDIIRTAKIELR
jgi:tripartite-type tricarboxylate transporter receptor subunit TctC